MADLGDARTISYSFSSMSPKPLTKLRRKIGPIRSLRLIGPKIAELPPHSLNSNGGSIKLRETEAVEHLVVAAACFSQNSDCYLLTEFQ